MKDTALEGVKIIEYCRTVTGAYATKIMADLGAEVIKIEPPGVGDDARRKAPFPGDVPHPEKSGLFLYLNSNKMGVTLDPKKGTGAEIFKKMIEDADVLVEDGSPGEMEKIGLGYDELKRINPGLVMTSITPYGRSGPYRDYKAYQLNTSNASGQANMLPLPSPSLDRAPVKPGGNLTDYDPALMAVVAILAAVFLKGVSGKGQFIEISKQEALINMQRVESVTFANTGVIMNRMGTANPMPGGIMPCKDGYVVSVSPEDHQWESLMELIGDPDWSKRDWCKDRFARAENAVPLTNLIVTWMQRHTKEQIYREGQALSCPIAPLHSSEDIVKSEQLRAREFFTEIEHPVVGKLQFPTAPYRFSKTPWQLRRPAPLLGESNEEIYCGRLGYSRDNLVKFREAGII
ncbi:MAG: CoA transferase [Deltaproteobacteria bacterium]|nr:CoA transferase [Deltaproteobacteria bacterium]